MQGMESSTEITISKALIKGQLIHFRETCQGSLLNLIAVAEKIDESTTNETVLDAYRWWFITQILCFCFSFHDFYTYKGSRLEHCEVCESQGKPIAILFGHVLFRFERTSLFIAKILRNHS